MAQIHILKSQKGWLAVDKPCGMSVHNDPGNDIVYVLSDRVRSDALLTKHLGVSDSFRIHPVHRLDKDSSGVILLATDTNVLRDLSQLFEKGGVKIRRYGDLMMKLMSACFILLGCLPFLTALMLTGCGNDSRTETEAQSISSPREKVINVALSAVVLQNLQEKFTLPGTLEAWENLTLAAEMAGPVRWIGPKEGDRVRKGEVILTIDPERREAELARDQVEYEHQQKRMERRGVLVERNLVSQQEFEDASKAFEQAHAQLRLSRVALDKSTLRSPVDGILDRLLVDRGEYVAEGTAAAVVMQVNRMRALVDVPEKDILDLAVGKKVQVFTALVGGASGPGLSGEIIHISFQADPATRTYQAKIAVDNSTVALRAGMIVQVGFTRRELAQVIAVPLYALVDREGGKVVYVEQGGKAQLHPVKIGPIVGNLAVIEEGLSPGDRLIVKGQQLVSDGGVVVEEGP